MKTLSIMAIAALSFSAVASSAQEARERETLSFPYEPHEIGTVEGAAALLQRIETYARSQCRLITDTGAGNPKSKACADDMVKQLIATIDSPHLHRAARGKGPTLAMLAE
jgi:UrcA family protein